MILHALNFAFAKIPIGIHTIFASIAVSCLCVLVSFLLRQAVTTILPFDAVILALSYMPLADILFGMLKFIPVKDHRTGQVKKWAIGTHL